MEQYKDNIFLDDHRQPWEVTWGDFDYSKTSWVIVRDYETFMDAIKLYFPLRISFDHDLGTTRDGMDCVKWLCNYCIEHRLKLPQAFFHTKNPVGAENMRFYIDSFKKING